jgi:hypothetical protein
VASEAIEDVAARVLDDVADVADAVDDGAAGPADSETNCLLRTTSLLSQKLPWAGG